MAKHQQAVKWYDERGWAALLAVAALLLAFAIGSRSLDTGSWQQYFLTFLLVILAINRVVHAIRTPHAVGLK